MNKKVFLITILLLLYLGAGINYLSNFCLTKRNVAMTAKQAQETCADRYCEYAVDAAGLDDNQIIYVDITYGNKIVKIIEYIILLSIIIIMFYYFYRKKGIDEEDINFSKFDYLVFSSLANIKIINLSLINFNSTLVLYILFFLFLGYFSFFCLFFIFKLLFKNKSIAILLSVFVINVLVLNYNSVFGFQELNYFIINKSIIADCILVILAFIFTYHNIINKILKNFAVILLTICLLCNSSIFLKNLFSYHTTKMKHTENETFVLNKNFNKNIYIIIMDMYGGYDTLNYLGFKNDDFINKLEKRDFLVFKNIDSNYSKTHLSIPSALNFKYIHQLPFNIPEEAIGKSVLFNSLKKANYNIYFSNYFFDMPNFRKEDFYYICHSEYINSFDFINVMSFGTCFENNTKFFQYIIGKLNFKSMPEVLNHAFRDTNKKLVFVHLPIPHFPYLYDENGNEMESISNITKGEITEFNTNSYLQYLKFGNKKVLEIVDSILSKDKNSVIIITGDHGARLIYSETNDKSLYENVILKNDIYLNSQFNTLLAYYNPDSDKQKYKGTKTILTFFRRFANEIFDKNFSEENRRFYIYFGQNTIFYDTVRYTEVK